MLTQILTRLIPFAATTFIAFFGNLIAHILRAACVFWTAAAPALIPAIRPYIEDPQKEIGVEVFLTCFGALFAGGLAAYVAIKNKNFGMRVQAMSVGFFLTVMSSPIIAGYIRTEHPFAVNLMEWIILFVAVIVGTIIGALSLRFIDTVNIWSTAVIGAYLSLQVFATLDYKASQGLAISDLQNGTFGCTYWGCYAVLTFFSAFALCGVLNQKAFMNIDEIRAESVDETGAIKEGTKKYHRFLLKMYNLISVFANPVFEMNDSVGKLGDELTADEQQAVIDAYVAAQYSFLSFLANTMLLSFGAGQLIGTIELFVRGVYTASDDMKKLGVILLLVAVVVIIFTVFGALTHFMPEENQMKRTRFKLYLGLAFVFTPVAGLISVLCFSLGLAPYIRVPYIIEKMGLQTLLSNRTALSCTHYVMDVGMNCTQSNIGLDPVAITLDEEMPSVAWNLALMAIFLLVSVVLVSKSLGGWVFLAMQLLVFTALLIMGNGVALAIVGFVIDHKKFVSEFTDFNTTEVTLFNALATVSAGLFLVSFIGLAGAKFTNKIILAVYSFLLFLLGIVLLLIYLFAAYYAWNAPLLVERDWHLIQPELVKAEANDVTGTIKNITKADFIAKIHGGYEMVAMAGGATMVFMTVACCSSWYVVNNRPEKATGDSLGAPIKVTNPILDIQ